MRGSLPRILFALAACRGDSYLDELPPPPKAPDITVKLASTRLGADCGESRPEPKPEEQRIPCEQTAVHLSIRSTASALPTKLAMKRVELLDRSGKLLEVLSAHSPSRWGTDSFVAWDESIGPGQLLAVGYKLKSPDWSKIPNANKRSFKMRITVMVGGQDQTFEATAELRIEDASNVVT
jgi:hypothetical protein